VFDSVTHFQHGQIFACKAGACSSKAPLGLHSKGKLLALQANARLEWKGLTVTTLAYHDNAKNCSRRIFHSKGPWCHIHNTVFPLQFANGPFKLECLSLAILSNSALMLHSSLLGPFLSYIL